MEQRLNIITLGVADLEKSRAFYLGGLGWTAAEAGGDEITFIQMNGVALSLYQHEALAKDAGVAADRSSFRGFSMAYNVRTRADVDATLHEAARAGATITKPAQDAFWGGYSGCFADPDGFIWEVAHNPFVTLDETGAFKI